MRAAIVIALWLPVLVLAGVWDITPFGNQFDRGNAALRAGRERLTAVQGPDAWTNYMVAALTNDYFKQASKLKVAKAMLAAAVTSYVDAATVSSGSFATYLDANGTFKMLTKTGILARAAAPTNWFDLTPSINLSGHSNGWPRFYAVITNLIVTDGAQYPSFDYTMPTNEEWLSYVSFQDAWDNTTPYVWNPLYAVGHSAEKRRYIDGTTTNWLAWKGAGQGDAYGRTEATYTHVWDYYYWVEPLATNDWLYVSDAADLAFDAMGDDVIEGIYRLAAFTNAEISEWATIGPSFPADWPDVVPDTDDGAGRGWAVYSYRVAVWWNVAGGFSDY